MTDAIDQHEDRAISRAFFLLAVGDDQISGSMSLG